MTKLKKRNRQKKEVRQQTLSLCMIVKNEEHYLVDCLESVKGIANEIVIVDTGSTDRTVEIAGAYGARISSFEWVNDFSAARNESLKLAAGDWILYMDADERLYPGKDKTIKKLMKRQDVDAYTVQVISEQHNKDHSETYRMTYSRLFRRDPRIRFEGVVHEQVSPSLQRHRLRVEGSDIIINHLGYGINWKTLREKNERNIGLLKSQLAKTPDDMYTRFQLANSYATLEYFDDMHRELKRVLKSASTPRSIRVAALNLEAVYAYNTDKTDHSLQYTAESLSLIRSQTTGRWIRANALFKQQEYEGAIKEMKEIIRDYDFLNRGNGHVMAYDIVLPLSRVYRKIGECLQKLVRDDEAVEAFGKAFQDDPADGSLFGDYYAAMTTAYEKKRVLDILKKLNIRYPDTPFILNALADQYRDMFDIETANSFIEKSRRINEKHPGTVALKAKWHIEDGCLETAEEILLDAVDKGIDSYEIRKYSLDIALKKQNFSQAILHLQKMVQYIPEDNSDLKTRVQSVYNRLSAFQS
jgi:glycosyltransferase involved in cell wall biosynthesis